MAASAPSPPASPRRPPAEPPPPPSAALDAADTAAAAGSSPGTARRGRRRRKPRDGDAAAATEGGRPGRRARRRKAAADAAQAATRPDVTDDGGPAPAAAGKAAGAGLAGAANPSLIQIPSADDAAAAAALLSRKESLSQPRPTSPTRAARRASVETASTASSESGGALPAVQKAVAAVASAFARVLTGGADAKPAASPSRRGTAGDAASTSSDDTLGDLDVPDAAVAVLSLSPPGADESTANLPPPASGKLRHLRALRQFSTVPDAAAAWPERPRHVWVDVATTAPEDVKLLAVRWGLRDDTVRHILHPSHHDELQLHAAYLELRINLTARPEMDDDDDYAQVVTFLVTNDALISFHQPECESVRAVLAQNQVVLLPPREDPALASVSGALDVVAAPPTPASHALSAASSVSGAPTGGSDGAAAAPPPPVAAAPVAATLRPDQLLCEVLYSFVRDCANVMQRHDDEIEELHELMLVLAENERSDYLRRITLSRSDLMAMRRHLAIKRALLRNLLVGRPSLFITADAYPYLRYIFEQVDYYARAVSMAKDALNQVQANYLAKLNVDMADVAQRTNDNVKVFTIVATLSLPVNMVSGIMGMNVWYPGRIEDDQTIGPFLTSLAVIIGCILLMALIMWRLGLF